MIQELENRIAKLEAAVNQIIRQGLVTSTQPGRGTVRVTLPDSDGVVSKELPVLFPKTLNDKYYAMPDVGEQVLCVFLPNGLEQGFILGSFFSTPDPPPVNSPDKTHIRFDDGTWLEYDRKTHLLRAEVVGEVDINAQKIHLNPR